MTCGLALKRPYDYEAYLSPDGASQAKRQRANAHCSPFRPQLGTIAASLPTSSTSSALKVLHKNAEDNSPFALVAAGKLTSAQIESYLQVEVKELRRRKLIPKRRDAAGTSSQATPSTSYRVTSNCGGSSDEECEQSSERSGSTRQKSPTSDLHEKPQFSLKHVQLICERLLKEQEVRLRYEYEVILDKRLAEQHEKYVQFAKEQFEENFARQRECDYSYVS
ncbi:hypothetical protein L596_009196 [Steinernema carpocapsae]|uniref:Akirin n=1 Tax=Steinernema carpocapsae TaxID=34508 RepID=A0A4U5PFG4_STECR|nr:hypothetical protein L596_009196 [Steinernema carpocapsae]